nr:hypothetical protein [Methanosarcina horonobensis]
MYLEIAMLAYFVVLFLTIRDIRIFKRTGYFSYRKGALKGLAASSLILLGAISVEAKPEIGLLIVLLGLTVNRKGAREPVFTSAGTLDRFLGKTDYVKKQQVEKKTAKKAEPSRNKG